MKNQKSNTNKVLNLLDALNLIIQTCGDEARLMDHLTHDRALQAVYNKKRKEGLFQDITPQMSEDLFEGGLLKAVIEYSNTMIDTLVFENLSTSDPN